MRGEKLRGRVCSVQVIANADEQLRKQFKIKDKNCSLGLITTTCDDVSYTALDEATKQARVRVVYAKSFYGGAGSASTKLAGEFIGILAGDTPEDIKDGLGAAVNFIEHGGSFVSANEENDIVYYAHCISRCGSYLSTIAKVKEGEAIAYLIAPPLEAIYAIEQVLKNVPVTLKVFYSPPTETNFGGGLLTGEQSACESACEIFAAAVEKVAKNPIVY